jgi:Type II secretion system (T2SS), protein M subtype b
MSVTLSPSRQRWLALSLLALVLVGLGFFIVAPVWASISRHEERVAMLRVQAGKLEALGIATPKFEAAVRQMAANAEVQALAFQGAPGTAVAELQAAVNRAFSSAGAVVMSGQALDARPGAALGEIAVQATIETDIAGLVQALHAIGTSRPLLYVERISVREPDADFAGAAPVGPQPNVANKLIVEIVVSSQTRRGL